MSKKNTIDLSETKNWRARQRLGTLLENIKTDAGATGAAVDRKDFNTAKDYWPDVVNGVREADLILNGEKVDDATAAAIASGARWEEDFTAICEDLGIKIDVENADSAVNEASDKIRELRAMPCRWIDPDNELPRANDLPVLVYCPIQEPSVGMAIYDGKCWRDEDREEIPAEFIDAWAFMPEPPKADK